MREMLAAVRLDSSDVKTPVGRIIQFSSDMPLFEAFYTLLGNNILSAPVRDSDTDEWLGFLDMRDLVSFIVLRHQKERDATERVQKHREERKEEPNAVIQKRPRSVFLGAIEEEISEESGRQSIVGGSVEGAITQSSVADEKDFIKYLITRRTSQSNLQVANSRKKSIVMLKYLCKRNPFCPVSRHKTLLDVAEILCTGVHCVPVVDDDGEIVNIISQSFLSSFVYEHRSKISDLLSKPLGLRGTSPVVSVTSEMSVCKCLETLDSKHLTGMPILDEDTGRLVGNFSGTDLRYYLKAPTYDKLELGVYEYITKNRGSRPKHAPGYGRPAVVSFLPTDTLGDAVEGIARHKIHRIYIDSSKDDPELDEEDRFLSVLSIVDLIRIFVGRERRKDSNSGSHSHGRRSSSFDEDNAYDADDAGTFTRRRKSDVERGRLAALHLGRDSY